MKIFVLLLAVCFVLATDDNLNEEAESLHWEAENQDGGTENQDGEDENLNGEDECQVQIPYGCVKCTKEKSPGEGKLAFCYRGIPYATLLDRFGNSLPLTSNPNPAVPYNSDNYPLCYQPSNTIPDNISISENCLYLNVFVPEDSGNELLPVMVYIHGGMFEGGGPPNDPSPLLNKGVIVVTINYRLGVFGFLSTGTCECSGNAGMKDCLSALQWVNANIAYFGGDPKRVTVSGSGSGAAMVTALQLNPLACNLVQNYIIESGTILAPWAYLPLKKIVENAVKLGEKTGCNIADPSKLCSCLKKVPADLLLQKAKELVTAVELMTFSIVPFALTSENAKCRNTFITQDPETYLAQGSVCGGKMLIGVKEDEGCGFRKQAEDNPNLLTALSSMAYKIAPKCLAETTNILCIKFTTLEIIAHYATGLILNPLGLVKLLGTVGFLLPINIFAQIMTKLGLNVFFYNIAQAGPCSVGTSPDQNLTCHAEQYQYLFPSPLTQQCSAERPNSNDAKVSDILTTLYSNFAKCGCPTTQDSPIGATLPAYTPDKPAYLQIDEGVKVLYGLANSELRFWKNLLEKCFLDIWGMITNPGSSNCCSTCSKDFIPFVN